MLYVLSTIQDDGTRWPTMIWLLSADKERTATAVCEGECNLYSLTQDVVLQLFYQKPEFSFFLVRLVTKRLLDNLEDAHFDAMATLGPAAAR